MLAQPAIQAVKDGRIKFVPQHFERIYLNWMENVHDWEISRQLWWGHRIPVWYCQQCPDPIVPQPGAGDPEQCPTCGGALEQDPDVLDTWFSSALWPFSTLGWPDRTEDLAYFYPTDVLETGYEIIFLWVARMIMTGIEFMGEPPFHHVYMHGIIRHQDGSKISKSNPQPGDDPLDVIEEYGADALRYWIVTGSTPGQDVRLSLPKIANARNFANKLWNAARFVVLARDRSDDGSASDDGGWTNLGLAERWILSRCHATIAEVTRQMEVYQFGEAGPHAGGLPVGRILRLVHRAIKALALCRRTRTVARRGPQRHNEHRAARNGAGGVALRARRQPTAAPSDHAVCHGGGVVAATRRPAAGAGPDGGIVAAAWQA